MEVFTVGGVLGRSFSIWGKNLIPFSLLAALVYSPVVVYMVVAISEGTYGQSPAVNALVSLATVVLSLIVTGAITYGVFEQMRGRPAPIGRCLSIGLSRLLPILGVGILVGLCVMGGFMLLIVPGIILLCMLWLSVPITVVEKVGPLESMKRSRQLTEGNRVVIFGILFVLWLFQFVLDYALEALFLSGRSLWTYFILAMVVSIIFMALTAVANAVAYHDIRQVKEGIDVEQLIAVFE